MPPAEAHIIGAGPAGLSCALELSRRGRGPLVLEKEAQVGGIARTEQVAGCRFDLGPHRFFTKEPEIRALWQGLLGKDLLTVQRLTRIYYRNRFFDYPLKLLPTLRKLGPVTSLAILGSYLWARVRPCRDPRSFEEWVVNQFGRRLFETFFRSYTEKVWGMPCDQISADWAAQRIKQLSLLEMVKGALGGDRARHASLIEEFHYPRHGAGMMWEAMAREIQHRGGDLRLGTTVTRLEHNGRRVTGLEVNGERLSMEGGVVSAMPLRETLLSLEPEPPLEVLAAARGLRYRGLLLVALVIPVRDLFPDNWIYVHVPQVQVARISSFRNFSPEMAPDPELSVVGLEYFCWPSEGLWDRPEEELLALGEQELTALGLLHGEGVRGGKVVRVPAAYPVYDPDYQERLQVLRSYLASLKNLQVIGRAGMHRYNNMDHSILTGLLAARNLLGESHDLWRVNLEEEYHEEARTGEALSNQSGD